MSPADEAVAIAPDVFERAAAKLRALVGFDLRPEKRYLLTSRLGPVARRFGVADVGGLLARFGEGTDRELEQAVTEALSTHETSFFRDTRVFDTIRARILPAIFRCAGDRRVRIWSAAASTGQEAYSLAMICTDLLGQAAPGRVEILGTDHAESAVGRARAATYSAFEVQRGVPAALLVRHFERVDGGFRLRRPVAELVRFECHNLMDDPSRLGRFDLVLLRNVLIYMDESARRRVLRHVVSTMRRNGYLVVGASECLNGFQDLLAQDPADYVVYRPRGRARPVS